MLTGSIVLLTDRPDRSRPLSQAIDTIAECVTADLSTLWHTLENVRAIVADVTLANPDVRRCLKEVQASFRAAGAPPMVFLARWETEMELREAMALGASTCISAKRSPRAIVALLMDLIHPSETLADIVVGREVARAGSVLHGLLSKARDDEPIDLDAIDQGVDPVLRATREGGLSKWVELVWQHDDATFQHCLLVAGLTATFAAGLGLREADQRLLTRGALVHDLGKAKIPLEILNKPGALSDYEQLVMRAHPVLGHDLLKASGERDSTILAMTRHHHELLDGTGYPDGLSGKAIADPVRILTICDIYAALIEHRSYKPALTSAEALQRMHGMGGKLEGALVSAFEGTLKERD